MGFLHVLARLYAVQLCHEAVHHVFVVLRLVGLGIVDDTEFHEFRVGQVVEGEEVGAGFLECGAVFLEGVGVNSGHELAGGVSEALVEVGVEHVGDVEVILEELACGSVDDELLVEAVAVRSHVVGLGDVLDGDRLGTVLRANPVGVGEVDADGGCGISVAAEHGCRDGLGGYALDVRFTELGVHRRVVFEPLCVVGDGLGALGAFLILEVDV